MIVLHIKLTGSCLTLIEISRQFAFFCDSSQNKGIDIRLKMIDTHCMNVVIVDVTIELYINLLIKQRTENLDLLALLGKTQELDKLSEHIIQPVTIILSQREWMWLCSWFCE